MMKRLLLLSCLVLPLSGGALLAATHFDVAVGIRVNEDSRIFLNLANEAWRPSDGVQIVRRCADPQDDFPVIAFLAYHSHRSPGYILSLRQAGYDWSDIFVQLNVSPRVLFVGIDRDPGGAYHNAYVEWRRFGDSSRYRGYGYGRRGRFHLSDRDVVALVKVQTASRSMNRSAFTVIMLDKGRRPDVYLARHWKERNRRDTWDRNGDRGGRHRDRDADYDRYDDRYRDHDRDYDRHDHDRQP